MSTQNCGNCGAPNHQEPCAYCGTLNFRSRSQPTEASDDTNRRAWATHPNRHQRRAAAKLAKRRK